MILDILISQYSETEKDIKTILDSIAMQQGIDFNNLKITIGNDGSDMILSQELLSSYDFKIEYKIFEHSGVSGIRKNLFHITSGDYLMFCDGDDMFASNLALNIYFELMNQDYDIIIPNFVEEIKIENKTKFHIHDKDPVFVHGKVYKRKHLLDNEIEWNTDVKYHEDSAYNVLAITLTPKVCYYSIPLYIWKDRRESIAREELHLPKSWIYMIDSYDSCVTDLMIRGYGFHARYYSYYCLWATYYAMMAKYWREADTDEYDQKIYTRLKKFIKDHRLLLKNCDAEMQKKAQEVTLEVAQKKGPLQLDMTFEEWFTTYLES